VPLTGVINYVFCIYITHNSHTRYIGSDNKLLFSAASPPIYSLEWSPDRRHVTLKGQPRDVPV